MSTLLFSMLLAPLAAGLALLLFARAFTPQAVRGVALVATLATLVLSLALARDYRALVAHGESEAAGDALRNAASPIRPRFEVIHPWLTLDSPAAQESGALPMTLEFRFGLDGVSIAMIVLTTVLTVSCVLISWESIRERQAGFFAALLILETGMLGVFCAFDAVLFYVFFEFTLIPLYFMIALWGGPQRRYAANKFFLYTLAGSLVTLLGLVTLVGKAAAGGLSNPCSLPDLAAWLRMNPLSPTAQTILFLALSAGFLIKVPVFPFHTWLPLAHVEAPTAGSVLLAGVLLKLGSYGFFRLCLPMLPVACLNVGVPMIAILSVIGIVYGSLCALVQRDVKKLVAYSSVAHLGFCMLGLFALNVEGLTGGILQMINHGLSTGALFLLVGMVYDRYHTRMVDDLGGLATRLPLIAATMVFISMASVGLPGLNGFVGEVLSLAGMFKRNPLFTAIGATGVVLGAWYLLTMLQHVFFGPLKEPHHDAGHHHEPIRDMNLREAFAVGPLAILCLWIGVRPQPLIESIRPEVEAVAALYPQVQTPAPVAIVGHPSRPALLAGK